MTESVAGWTERIEEVTFSSTAEALAWLDYSPEALPIRLLPSGQVHLHGWTAPMRIIVGDQPVRRMVRTRLIY